MYKASVAAQPPSSVSIQSESKDEFVTKSSAQIWKLIRNSIVFVPLFVYFLTQLGLLSWVSFIQEATQGFCTLGSSLPFIGEICGDLQKLKYLSPEIPPIEWSLSKQGFDLVKQTEPAISPYNPQINNERPIHVHIPVSLATEPYHHHHHSHPNFYQFPTSQTHYITIVSGYPGILPPQPILVRSDDKIIVRNNDINPHRLVYIANDYRQEKRIFPQQEQTFIVPKSSRLWRQFIYSAGDPRRVFIDLIHQPA